LKISGVNITEIVYIRTIQSTGVGVKNKEIPQNINLSLQGICYLKSEWDIAYNETGDGTNANKISIDGIKYTFSTTMPEEDAITGVNFAYFNEMYKQIMIETLGLKGDDISIIGI
jgi:hypothetical protein